VIGMSVIAVLQITTMGNAFQFMKDWKMPTYDPNEDAVKEKFGDKSTYVYVCVCVCVYASFFLCFFFVAFDCRTTCTKQQQYAL
jgi:hypothetical protein